MVGEKLGSFRIEGTLGVGAMGVVYKAVNETTGKPAAVKVILNEIAQKGKPYERFRREAEILQQFRHSNIVRFLAMGRYKGTSYFAMEFVQGDTLDSLLKERGPLTWREVVDLGIQLCDALHYAHEHGVVHRDLKPSNLMITEDMRLKLTDFGIAKDLDATALTATGRTLGTAAYMAPEQIRGTPEISHKTDLYALGVVLYQMLTGLAPFEGASAVQLMHSHLNAAVPRPSAKLAEIPKALDNLVVQLMAKEPAQRPWDAAAVSVTLTEIRDKADRGEAVPMVWSTGEVDAGAATRGAGDEVRKKTKKAVKARPKTNRTSAQGRGRQVAEIAGLVLALVAIGGVIAYILWPPSASSLYREADRLMASTDRHDWRKALDDYITPLDQKHPDNPYKETTRVWRDKILLADTEARAKVLQSPLHTKLTEPKTKTEERFVEHHVLVSAAETRHDDASAIRTYQEFARTLDPDAPEERGWLLLAQKRAEELAGSMAQRRESVRNGLKRVAAAIEGGQASEAESIRKELLDRYGQYPELAELLGLSPAGAATAPPPDASASDRDRPS